jgi:hypothetical protein
LVLFNVRAGYTRLRNKLRNHLAGLWIEPEVSA